MFEPAASRAHCEGALAEMEVAKLEQQIDGFHLVSPKQLPIVSERIAPVQQEALPSVSRKEAKDLMASLLSAPEDLGSCQDLRKMLGSLKESSQRITFVQQEALPVCGNRQEGPIAISVEDKALMAEVQELLASIAPSAPPLKNIQTRRCTVFEGQTPKSLIEKPPVDDASKEMRCLIVYSIALGLAKLHESHLCHMNVKAKHVELGRDTVTNGLLGRLVDDGSVVKIGDLFKHCTFEYVDQDIISSPKNIIANPAHDMWALGILFFELMHGQAANPLHQLKAPFTRVEWGSAVERLRRTLCPSDHIDEIISQLLRPARNRPSARGTLEAIEQHIGIDRCREFFSGKEKLVLERIIRPQLAPTLAPQAQCPLTPEMARTVPFLEETLFLAPKDDDERQERLVIAYHLAKDYTAKAPYFEAKIAPQFIELFQHPKTGRIIGAKLLCQTQRKEPLFDQQHSPDPNKFSFGLILFSMLFGKTSIGFEVDLAQLPDPETAEWNQIISNIRRHLGHHRVDITIDLLLTRPDFSVQSSVGVLERLLRPAVV
jgi:hypothetical protein